MQRDIRISPAWHLREARDDRDSDGSIEVAEPNGHWLKYPKRAQLAQERDQQPGVFSEDLGPILLKGRTKLLEAGRRTRRTKRQRRELAIPMVVSRKRRGSASLGLADLPGVAGIEHQRCRARRGDRVRRVARRVHGVVEITVLLVGEIDQAREGQREARLQNADLPGKCVELLGRCRRTERAVLAPAFPRGVTELRQKQCRMRREPAEGGEVPPVWG